MRRSLRWVVTVGSGAGVFAASWWVCQGWLGIDGETAQQLAGVMFGLVTLPLAWWAAADYEIAHRAALSAGTVRTYLSSAVGKAGAANRHEAARIAQSRGWLPP